MEQGIFGLHPWAVLLIGVILVLGFVLYSTRQGNTKLRKMTEGKVLVEFWPQASDIKTFLCEEILGEIKVPSDYKEDIKQMTGGDTKRLRAFRAPKELGSDVDIYYTTNEFMGDIWWPPMRPKDKQVKIKKTAFVVGIPLPAIYVALKKWTPEMLENLASNLIGRSRDEATLRALNAQDMSFWNNLDKFGQMLQKLPTMQIACFVAAGAAVIGMFMVWQLSGKMTELIRMFTGG